MTKRKAIEAATELFDEETLWEMHQYPQLGQVGKIRLSAQRTAENAYEAGRIAGLREAAKIAKGDPFGDVRILDRANTLAKKARAAK